MNQKESIIELLEDLNSAAMAVDHKEFGLPLHHEDNDLSFMINIVENFIKDLVQESNKKIVDIDCFKVYETDGYTRTKKYYVSSESLAMQLCHGNHYLGYENHKISYKIYDTLEEIKQGEREAKINAIKAKLTPEELELIGL